VRVTGRLEGLEVAAGGAGVAGLVRASDQGSLVAGLATGVIVFALQGHGTRPSACITDRQ
jgi:hypothetical protein